MPKGMTQSFFLNQFIDEIIRTKGAALAGTIAEPTPDTLAAELRAVALHAAHRVFGDATPIRVAIAPGLGDATFEQVLRVVKVPSDPKRELPLDVVRKSFPRIADGEELIVPIAYTNEPLALETRAYASFEALLPVPLYSRSLWEVLTEELTAALLRYFPGRGFPPGSLGALLASGGDWLRGASATSGDIELRITGAFLDYYPTRVTSGWCEYGLETVVVKAGVEIARGGRETGSAQIGGRYVEAIARGDNDSNLRAWEALPTSERARPRFLQALQALVDGITTEGLNGRVAVDVLLAAAVEPPIDGGFWTWLADAMPRVLVGHVHRFQRAGATLELAIRDAHPPQLGLGGFGGAAISFEIARAGPEPRALGISLGALGPEALALPAPTAEERVDLEQIMRTFCDWLDVAVEHLRVDGDLDQGFVDVPGHFPLVELLEQRLRRGPPGPPPVPPFDDAAIGRAASALAAIDVDGERVIAAYTIAGWKIVLRDDVAGHPWGSYCAIDITAPGDEAPVVVLMVDAWNPEARRVVDGDAFAFRRFASWLRGAIVRGDHDAVVRFAPPPDDGDDEATPAETIELKVSDWLRFGLPDTGDRFLVDWRAQWHIVDAVARVEDFVGIYGFSGEMLERLRGRDIPLWRRFLREVLDPRFAAAVS